MRLSGQKSSHWLMKNSRIWSYGIRYTACVKKVPKCIWPASKRKTYVGKYGVPATAEYSFDELNSSDYDGILVPGGWAPDKLRRYPKVLELVKEMHADRKPIGQICHAGWVLISAKILNGVTVTSTPGIRDDMENAAQYGKTKPLSWMDTSSPRVVHRILPLWKGIL